MIGKVNDHWGEEVQTGLFQQNPVTPYDTTYNQLNMVNFSSLIRAEFDLIIESPSARVKVIQSSIWSLLTKRAWLKWEGNRILFNLNNESLYCQHHYCNDSNQ